MRAAVSPHRVTNLSARGARGVYCFIACGSNSAQRRTYQSGNKPALSPAIFIGLAPRSQTLLKLIS
jgi:hypothetical protein